MKTVLACLLLAGAAFGALVCLMAPRRDRTRDWGLVASLGAVVALGAFVFFNIMEDVFEGDPSLAIDRMTYAAMTRLRGPGLDGVMTMVTELGDAVVVTAVALAVAAWLVYVRAWRTLRYWIAAIAGAAVINTAIKVALHRPRPTNLYHHGWDAFSFPSGHSTSNASLYGFLMLLLISQIKAAYRVPVVVAGLGLVAIIGFSRLYLGAHWLSDVAGGLVFASAWVATLSLLYLRKAPEPLRANVLALIAMAALVIAGGVNIAVNDARDLKLYRASAYGAPVEVR